MKRIFILTLCSVMSMQSAWSLNVDEQSLLKRLTESSSADVESFEQQLRQEVVKLEELFVFNDWLDASLYDFLGEEYQMLEVISDEFSHTDIEAAFLKLLHHELLHNNQSAAQVNPDESLIEMLIKKYVLYSGPKSSKMLLNHIQIVVPAIQDFQQLIVSYIATHSLTGRDLGMMIVFGEHILNLQTQVVAQLERQIKSAEFSVKMNQVLKTARMLHKQLDDVKPVLIAVESAVHDIAHESGFAPSLDPQVQKDVKVAESLLPKIKMIRTDFDHVSASLIPLRIKIVEEKDSGWQQVDV